LVRRRWTINLALETAGKMLYASNPMASADLSEADPKSVCAYMCFLFMSCYKLKQSKAVLNRLVSYTVRCVTTVPEVFLSG